MRAVLFAASIALALASRSALAADLYPLKAPTPPPSWTGCYVAAGIGYGMWSQDHYTESFPGLVPETDTGNQGGRGWLGRLGGGCDYQISPSIIVGALADYDAMSIHGGVQDQFTAFAGDEKETAAWYAGARIGYLVSPALLTYVDGGFTQTRYNQINLDSAIGGPITDFVAPHTYNGWFLGGGTEYALNFGWLPMRGLFWRNEYRISSYNSADLPILVSATGAPEGNAYHVQNYVQTATTSLIWRFNFGGPSCCAQ